MSTFDVLSFPNPDRLAQAVAQEWLNELEAVRGSQKSYCVALSGGRIARTFLSATANLAKSKNAAFAAVHFFWSDERCVPPTDPESNFYLAQQALLAPLAIPETQVHRIRGEDPPQSAAATAQAEISQFAPPAPDSQPLLDLIFLGMGEDGHVASLFPGESEEIMSSNAVYRSVVAAKPPPHRVTMGYPAIAAARNVWVLASGPGKEKALREALGPGGKTPLVRVLKLRSHTKIFTDVPL